MSKRMLIDATHPEETRVAVVDGTRLEDFDFEVAAKSRLKGNIYLARVTRVEPSLQAAFVEYGGNRHGFLAFSEIHPDYYRIPVADREKLIAEHKAAQADREIDEDEAGSGDDVIVPEEPADTSGEEDDVGDTDDDAEVDAPEDDGELNGRNVDDVAADAAEDSAPRRAALLRQYKIQEVIKRRQIMLVQVVKEERGNKGAALTTYLSLAGRYCVLMPNTARGGGVSRKITDGSDRRRLKKIVQELEIPDGMAVIVRTAGSGRTKAEIKRDYEYLMRLWGEIRETTLNSTAPCLIHEEGNLIKRSMRDLYARDIDEVIVEGEEGYKSAKAFMRQLMPSHAKRVHQYKDLKVSLFHSHQVESQINQIYSPTVQLKSGGYIVLNPTEALVSIDVNSGRSTRERHIEETALKTNLEAAEQIARQLRLRDLAGLIVIDFIDMEEPRANGQVERRLKEAMKSDRARTQIGRISHFGLLELSRQRLRPSILETSVEVCPTCAGSGHIRATDSTALQVLRLIEEEAMHEHANELIVHVPSAVAFYILNQKRRRLTDLEDKFDLQVELRPDDGLIPPDYRMERVVYGDDGERLTERVATPESEVREDSEGDKRKRKSRRRRSRPRREDARDEVPLEADEAAEAPAEAEFEAADEDQEEPTKKKRRRRGKRGGRRRSREDAMAGAESPPAQEAEGAEAPSHEAPVTREPSPAEAELAAAPAEDAERKPARRRRRKPKAAEPELESADTGGPSPAAEPDGGDLVPAEPAAKPARRRTRAPRSRPGADAPADQSADAPEVPAAAVAPESSIVAEAGPETADESASGGNGGGDTGGNGAPAGTPAAQPPADEDTPKSRRRGWWQKLME